MAKLANARHEAFARHLAKGRSQAESYRLAGFEDDTGHASRLLASNGSIAQRVEELKSAAARRAEVSIEWVLTRMKKIANSSDEKAAAKALDMIAKHLAMYEHTKRIEHSGTVRTETMDLSGLNKDKFEQLRALVQEARTSKRAD